MMVLTGCFAKMRTIGSRPLQVEPKNLQKVGSPVPAKEYPQQFYRKKTQLDIRETDEPSLNGSLFNVENAKNDLYRDTAPDGIGNVVAIAVVIPPVEGKTAEAKEQTEEEKKAAEDELIKDFPELEPPTDQSKRLLRSFNMKIAKTYPNGDVLAVYTRSSETDFEVKAVEVSARIPYEKLVSLEGVTTKDLRDVKFRSSDSKESVERVSTTWEDEYTLRISGFTEAQSKEASELNLKRQQLLQLRQNMYDRLKTFSSERGTIAKERDKLLKERKDEKEEMEKLKTKIKELEDSLTAKDQVIKEQEAKMGELEKKAPEGTTTQ